MFKTGVITDEISQDFKAAVELSLKHGLDGVEIRSVWEKSPHELSSKDIGEIRNILSDAGLEVCGISSPFFKCDLDSPSEIAQHLDILKRTVNLARELDTNIIRGFTFWKKGELDENINRIVANFEKPVDIVADGGVQLALETEPFVFGGNAQKLVCILDEINSPYVKALWDPGNDIWDPDGEIPYPDGYKIIKPYMVHIHLKDAVRKENGEAVATPFGGGHVDFKGQLMELKADGYNGYVVMETHYRPRHNIGEDLLAMPKGSAFSYLGYEATDESLSNLRKIMGSIEK